MVATFAPLGSSPLPLGLAWLFASPVRHCRVITTSQKKKMPQRKERHRARRFLEIHSDKKGFLVDLELWFRAGLLRLTYGACTSYEFFSFLSHALSDARRATRDVLASMPYQGATRTGVLHTGKARRSGGFVTRKSVSNPGYQWLPRGEPSCGPMRPMRPVKSRG
jgi:hypothetical protein